MTIPADAVTPSALGVVGIAVVAVMVLGLAILTSIVDRRITAKDAELRESEERYRLLFDRSLAGVYQSTLEGALLDCNDAFARMLGYESRQACLAHSAAELYEDPAERERFVGRLQATGVLTNFESQLRPRDGRSLWVLESSTLIRRPGESPLIEGTLVDITRRKEMERELAASARELAASAERYKQIVESTNAVPWEMDGTSLAVTYISPRAARLFGNGPGQADYETDAWTLIHPGDSARVRAELRALVAPGGSSDVEVAYRLLARDGRVVHVRSIASAHADGIGGLVIRGITLDVTEQRKLEMELQQAQKLESVGRLAAGVAHEINTPVQFVGDSLIFVQEAMTDLAGVITGYREIVGDDDRARVVEDTADLPYLLDNMPKAINRSLEGLDRVATIVRSMKEFAHPDQKEMTAVDVNQAVRSTLVVARNEYKYVAEVEVDLGDIPLVTCHGGDLNQAVLNILVNAAHAIESTVQGTDRKGQIRVRTWREGEAVVISIGDTGGGIPESIQERIFDPFFTTKEVGKGTGQGLAIARSVIVDKHGGDLTFDSQAGVGTTFAIHLPIAGKKAAGVAA